MITKSLAITTLCGAAILSHSVTADDFAQRPALADKPIVGAGHQINTDNLSDYQGLLNPTIAELVSRGLTSIELGDYRSFPIHPNYRAATEANIGKTQLGEGNGDITGYQTGRPFPGALSSADPRAGEKAIWNMRYGYGPDSSETRSMTWLYKSMASDSPERSLEMYGALMRFSHRHTQAPYPELESNPQALFSALYLRVDYPHDIRGTQLLTYTKADDAELEQAFMYLNTQRRVRRLATGQKTDSFLGSDIMIEDFLGYNGRIRDMQWQYLDSGEQLVPLYDYDKLPAESFTETRDGLKIIEFGGKGQCFPNIQWQARKVHRVKATPVTDDHPLAYRIFTLDAETYLPVLAEIYDRAGKLWKIGIVAASASDSHGPEFAEWQGAVTDAVTMIDLQAEHCTTLQFNTHIPEGGLRAQLFTTQQMRSAGR